MGLISNKVLKKNIVGFKPSDPARTRGHALSIARNYPKDMPAYVKKTGVRGDIYPYTIYVSEKFFGNNKATETLRKIYNK